MQDYKDLFSKVLTLGKVNPVAIPTIVDNNIKQFRQAFVDSSIDPVNNYEVFEFVGDAILGSVITDYIYKNSKIKTVKWMSKLKLYLISRKVFADFSKELELENFIIIDQAKKQKMFGIEKEKNKFYTDIFESLVFVISDVIEKETNLIGPKYTVIYNFISVFLDRLDINSLTQTDIIDAKSMLNDLFTKYKQNYSHNFNVVFSGGETRVTVNFVVNGVNQTIVVEKGRDKAVTETRAAKKAIDILEKKGYVL
jgi:ribonuclease III